MEVLCHNGKFSPQVLEFYKLNGISYPTEGKIYGIREVRREYGKVDNEDNVGILLDEILNPKVDTYHPVLGTIKIEPSFSIKRFSTLHGDAITKETLSEIIKQSIKI